jgi:hypothetical protein
MKRHLVGVLGLLLAIGAFGASSGCSENPVGRICDLGSHDMPGPGDVVVASPSLDCVTRTCLRVVKSRELPPGSQYPSGNNGLCTAECTADSDCDRVPESPCITGFTCGIPPGLDVGPFCCRKLCVCKDYIQLPDNGGPLPTPPTCDPMIKDNKCCNLDGRVNSPEYPLCKG